MSVLLECHQHTLLLCQWAADASPLLDTANPNWDAVNFHFTMFRQLRPWLFDHWGSLSGFDATHSQAVEWSSQGWRSWHAAMVENFVFDGHGRGHKLLLWVGTVEDTHHANMILPEECDWRQPQLQPHNHDAISNLPHLDLSRELVWRRLRFAAGRTNLFNPEEDPTQAIKLYTCPHMTTSGWAMLSNVSRWIHPQHLRSEFAAASRVSSSSPSANLDDYRVGRKASGALLTVKNCGKEPFKLTGPDLSKCEEAKRTRRKNPDGPGYIYPFKVVLALSEAKRNRAA